MRNSPGGKKLKLKKNSILSSKSVSYVLSVGKNLGCKEMPDENKRRGHLLLLQLLVHHNWCAQGHIRNWLHCSSTNNWEFTQDFWDPQWQEEGTDTRMPKGLWLYSVKWYFLLKKISDCYSVSDLKQLSSPWIVNLILEILGKSFLLHYSVLGVPANHISFSFVCGLLYKVDQSTFPVQLLRFTFRSHSRLHSSS